MIISIIKNIKVNHIPLFHSHYLKKNKPDLIIVCSSSYLDIFDKIKKMKIKTEYKYIYELFLLNDNNSELRNLHIDLLATKNRNFFRLIIRKPQILLIITFRLSKYFKKNILFPFYLIFYLMHLCVCNLSIQLPLNVKEPWPSFCSSWHYNIYRQSCIRVFCHYIIVVLWELI